MSAPITNQSDARVPSLAACLYLTCSCSEACLRVEVLGSVDPEQDARIAARATEGGAT